MKFLLQIWSSKDLRKKILFTIFILVLYRVLGQVTVPGVDPTALREYFSSGGDTGAIGIFSLITGGSLVNFSIILMGLAPYINASIVMQLMTVVLPKLEALSKESEAGRKKISQYTRWLTVPFAFLQSYGMIVLISNLPGVGQFIDTRNPAEFLPAMITITAGTLLLMWLGELINAKGIGNGISLLIFAGIVSEIPGIVQNIFASGDEFSSGTKVFSFLVFLAIAFVLLLGTILTTEGQRKIPITYGTRGKVGVGSSLPIRVLQAGMIPIIFALSLTTFPAVLAQMFPNAKNSFVDFINLYLNSSNPGILYFALYFCLILFFTFFYVSIVFKPEQIAENIQKRGGFVPGYRPGRETAEYLEKVSSRLNLWGGVFLGVVAIIPMVFTLFSDLTTTDLIISGSGIIIIVGVVLDLLRRVNAQLVMHDYEKLK